MSSPSIVPNDRLDQDLHLVEESFRSGAAFRETDEGITYVAWIAELLTGPYGHVQRIVAFNLLRAGLGTPPRTLRRPSGAHRR